MSKERGDGEGAVSESLSRLSYTKKKQWWILGESEGRWATRHQDGECGTDAQDGARTGVSERVPSAHPATTSVRCVWTQVYAGGRLRRPQADHVVGFVVRWKEDFVSMINRNFAQLLMMGVFSRVCSGVLWG